MMGSISHLPGGPHHEIQLLLPWYVTGRLDAADTARVDQHLDRCPQCSAQLALDRELDRAIVRGPRDVEQGWGLMLDRIEHQREARPIAAAPMPPIRTPRTEGSTAWKRWLGFGLGAQLAATALIAAIMLPPQFQALGTHKPPAVGNIIVIFEPETTEQALRQTLRDNAARVVDGPTTANAYVLQVPAARREQLVAKLRSTPQIVLAEPIGADAEP